MELLKFFEKVNNDQLSKLDMLDYIERRTNNDFANLKIFLNDLEKFKVDRIANITIDELTTGKTKQNDPQKAYDILKPIIKSMIDSLIDTQDQTTKKQKEIIKHYQLTKRYVLQPVITAYNPKRGHYNTVAKTLNNYIEGYKFLYHNMNNGLDLKDGHVVTELRMGNPNELRYDVLDHLEKVKNIQVATKYKLLINEAIKEIESVVPNPSVEINSLEDTRPIPTQHKSMSVQSELKRKAGEKNFNVDDFKFSPDVLLKSKEDFEAFLNQRYGDKYKSDQLNQIVDKYYGENALAIRQEAQKKVDAKAYIGSLYSYDLFKKSMEDENYKDYYLTLKITWEQSRKKYINENGLKGVDGNSLPLFNTYLSNILSIYRHVYKYSETDSIKDLNTIPLKKAKFDCLMNEQTDRFVAHLKSEKVKGNYKMLLNRKDYVLGLFGSLEKFLVNASINFDKSPFKEIFGTSKGKIENAVSFDEVKFLAGQSGNDTSVYSKERFSPTQKAAIVMDIKGDNDWNTTSTIYHHIKSVLDKHSLTSKEAMEIMLDMKGMNSPEVNENVVEPIIGYLGRIDYQPEISVKDDIKPVNRNEPKLSINQIALKYSYQGLQITRQNGNEIAKKYGHSSGEKLFQRFTFYSSPTNRKGKPIPCTLRKLTNKINLLNSVVELLSDDKKDRAKDEVNILNNILENEFQ